MSVGWAGLRKSIFWRLKKTGQNRLYVQKWLSFRLVKHSKLKKNGSIENMKAVVKCKTSRDDIITAVFLEHLDKAIQKTEKDFNANQCGK